MIFVAKSYVKSLQDQILFLRQQLRESQDMNKKFVEHVIPAMRHREVTAQEIVEKKKEHKITKDERHAGCSCGWHFTSSDPAVLQMSISEHHRENMTSVKASTRVSWPRAKSTLERVSEESADGK